MAIYPLVCSPGFDFANLDSPGPRAGGGVTRLSVRSPRLAVSSMLISGCVFSLTPLLARMYFNSLVFVIALETETEVREKKWSFVMGWQEWVLVEWLFLSLKSEPPLVIILMSLRQT